MYVDIVYCYKNTSSLQWCLHFHYAVLLRRLFFASSLSYQECLTSFTAFKTHLRLPTGTVTIELIQAI